MITQNRLDGHLLTIHEVDEDGEDNGITPGHWEEADCQGFDAARIAAGIDNLHVYSSCTDPDGVFGAPAVYTEWGIKNGDTPVAAGVTHYRRGSNPVPGGLRNVACGCEHAIYVVEE